jgi:hypothetical protein
MDLELWWVILLLPVLAFGIVLGFFPQKVVQFRAKLQHNMFKALNVSDEWIDRSIFSKIFGERYSERLEAQKEKPKEFRILVYWIRIIGLFALLVFILMLFVVISYITLNLEGFSSA